MFLIAIAVPFAILALAATLQLIFTRRDALRLPPPGRLVKSARGLIHVHKLGAGKPAIILESGISSSSLSWSGFQSKAANIAACYSYDRAGLAWSPWPRQHSCALRDLVDDLHTWLTNSEVPAPFILVAHSFGAYIVRAYAQRYPERVKGLVLVDPLAPEEWSDPTPRQFRMLRRGAQFSTVGAWLARFGVVRFCLWLAQRGNRKAPSRVLESFGPGATATVHRILGEISKLPPDVLPYIRAHWSAARSFRTMARYLGGLPACTAELLACPALPTEIPITVLTGAQQPEVRLAEHKALAESSRHGKHIVAKKSGHWIHLDEPELVLDAIREMASLPGTAGPEPQTSAPEKTSPVVARQRY